MSAQIATKRKRIATDFLISDLNEEMIFAFASAVILA